MSDVEILLVEDENIVAMDIKNRIEHLGYSVSGLVDAGEKAIKASEESPPDLILMDIKLVVAEKVSL